MFIRAKNIYKCRLCGMQFEEEKCDDMRSENMNTNFFSPYNWHKCDDGRNGFSDLLGTYGGEVINE